MTPIRLLWIFLRKYILENLMVLEPTLFAKCCLLLPARLLPQLLSRTHTGKILFFINQTTTTHLS